MPHIVARRRYTFRRRRLWIPSKAPAAPSFSAYWAGGINAVWQDGIKTMKKNVASQKIGAQLVSASDGSAFTGSVTVYVTGDAGTQAVGSVGSGACTHEGNGYHTYAPAQAETNYDLIAFTFTGTGAIPVTIQVYTSFPQTGDSYAEVNSGTYGLSQIKTQTAAIEVDTQDIQSRLPAALVGGRMDANTSAIGGSTTPVTNIGTVFNTDFATNYNTTIDMWNVNVENWNTTAVPAEHTAGYPIVTVKDGTGTGEINTNAGAIALVDLVTTTTTATNVTTVNGIAANAITASSLATDAVAEIADGIWDETLSGHLTAGSTGEALNAAGSAGDPWTTTLPGSYTGSQAGKILADILVDTGTTLDGLIQTVDTVVDAIKVKTDYLPSATAGAAGGVFIAGSNAATTVNITGNITGNLSGSVGSVTGSVTVGTNNDKTGYTLSTAGLAALFASDSGTTYASAVAGSVVKEIADNAGGSGLTAGAIADAVWDEAISGHLTAGSTGNALNAAGSAGDPWSTTLPGSYTGTQAGFIIGTIRAAELNILSPIVSTDNSIEIVIGDDYYAADNRNLSFSYGASPSLSGATVTLEIQEDTTAADSDTNYTSTTGTVSGTNPQVVSFDLPGTTTDDLSEGWHAYRVKAVLSNSHTVTLTRGRIKLLQRGDDAPRT